MKTKHRRDEPNPMSDRPTIKLNSLRHTTIHSSQDTTVAFYFTYPHTHSRSRSFAHSHIYPQRRQKKKTTHHKQRHDARTRIPSLVLAKACTQNYLRTIEASSTDRKPRYHTPFAGRLHYEDFVRERQRHDQNGRAGAGSLARRCLLMTECHGGSCFFAFVLSW